MIYKDLPYFAYGSNLNLSQMQMRCKMAQDLGRAELPGFELTFRGVADIERSATGTVDGGLFRITARCLEALDRYEGYPTLYTREYVEVIDKDGDLVEAFVYVMQPEHPRTRTAMPGRWYFETIRKGFHDFGLNDRSLWAALEKVRDEVELDALDRGFELAGESF